MTKKGRNKNQKEVSLGEYLNKNKELLTILGVFVAIAALCAGLSIKLIAAIISFASFTCSTLILLELCRNRSFKKGTKYELFVHFFKAAFIVLAAGFFLYWFVVVDVIYPDLPFPVLIVLIMEFFVVFVNRLKEWFTPVDNFFYRIGKHKIWTLICAIIITALILVAARALANYFDASIFELSKSIIRISSEIKGSIQ